LRNDAGASRRDWVSEADQRLIVYKNMPLDMLVSFSPPMRITRDEKEDQEFQASLREYGIRDTLLVRPHPTRRDFLEVVDGNRRLAHGRVVGLKTAPCEIREMTDEEAFSIALVRNVQRSSVTSMGIGNWLQLMQMKFQYTQQKLAEILGKDQSWVSRHLKLINSEIAGRGPFHESGENSGENMPHGINIESEFQARAFRSAPDDVQQQILEGAKETGKLPPGREIMRKSQTSMTVEEVLKEYSQYDDEFLEHQLQVKAGKTATEAADIVWEHRNRRKAKKQVPISPIVDRRNKTVRVYEQLSRYYPTNLIDLVDKYTNSSNLETLMKYCKMLTQKMFEIAPQDLQQTVIETFI